MPTIQQLVRKGREIIKAKSKSRALDAVLNVVVYVQGFIQLPLKNQTLLCVKLQKCV